LIAVGFFGLVHWRSISMFNRASNILGTRPFRWLGEVSYGVYLLHLLILQPVAGWAIRQWGAGLSGPERFLLVSGLVVPLTYALAFVAYGIIEMPGQRLGKMMLKAASRDRRTAKQVPAEQSAAP
jgi:peptidoglycan/LPS O-acetylase OafA/YrhL